MGIIDTLESDYPGLVKRFGHDTFVVKVFPMQVLYQNGRTTGRVNVAYGVPTNPNFSIYNFTHSLQGSMVYEINLFRPDNQAGITYEAQYMDGSVVDKVTPLSDIRNCDECDVITHLQTRIPIVKKYETFDSQIYTNGYEISNLISDLKEIKNLFCSGFISSQGIVYKIQEEEVDETMFDSGEMWYIMDNFPRYTKRIDNETFRVQVYPIKLDYYDNESYFLLLDTGINSATVLDIAEYFNNTTFSETEVYKSFSNSILKFSNLKVSWASPYSGKLIDIYPVVRWEKPKEYTKSKGLHYYGIPKDIDEIFKLLKYIDENENISLVERDIRKGLTFKIGIEKRKEEVKIMKNKNIAGMNFEFGPVDNRLGLSVNGIAFRNNEGNYVTYNAKTNTITDVSEFTFNIDGMLWSIPVTIDQIKANDIILHKGDFVVAIADYDKEKGNSVDVVNPITQTKQTILPTQNIFGFNFITKVVNCASAVLPTGEPDAANPFGNMIPLMMFSNLMDNQNGGNDMVKMLALNSFMNKEDGENPFAQMMPFFAMKNMLN